MRTTLHEGVKTVPAAALIPDAVIDQASDYVVHTIYTILAPIMEGAVDIAGATATTMTDGAVTVDRTRPSLTAAQITAALANAMELCEGKTIGTPRKQRFEAADAIESAMELLVHQSPLAERLDAKSKLSASLLPGMERVQVLCDRLQQVKVGTAEKADVEACAELASLVSGLAQTEAAAAATAAAAAAPSVLVLQGGGEAAAAAVVAVLEHALDLMDVRIAGTPRQERGKIAERLEDLQEKVETLVPVLSALPAGELQGLASILGSVQGIREADLTGGGADVAGEKLRLIGGLLEALERL